MVALLLAHLMPLHIKVDVAHQIRNLRLKVAQALLIRGEVDIYERMTPITAYFPVSLFMVTIKLLNYPPILGEIEKSWACYIFAMESDFCTYCRRADKDIVAEVGSQFSSKMGGFCKVA